MIVFFGFRRKKPNRPYIVFGKWSFLVYHSRNSPQASVETLNRSFTVQVYQDFVAFCDVPVICHCASRYSATAISKPSLDSALLSNSVVHGPDFKRARSEFFHSRFIFHPSGRVWSVSRDFFKTSKSNPLETVSGIDTTSILSQRRRCFFGISIQPLQNRSRTNRNPQTRDRRSPGLLFRLRVL
jgi:hypothetical protein